MAIADVLAEQVKHIDADVIQVDEANLPGSPGGMGMGGGRDESGARRHPDRACGASLLRQLRRPDHSEGRAGASSSTI